MINALLVRAMKQIQHVIGLRGVVVIGKINVALFGFGFAVSKNIVFRLIAESLEGPLLRFVYFAEGGWDVAGDDLHFADLFVSARNKTNAEDGENGYYRKILFLCFCFFWKGRGPHVVQRVAALI